MSGKFRQKDLDPARVAARDTLRAVRERDAYANLVLPKMLREEFTSPLEVTPLYLRRPDIHVAGPRKRAT